MSSVVSDISDIQEIKRGRPISHVWDHFVKETLGSGHYSARCHYCNMSWSRGRPETLKAHLALYCDRVPLNVKGEYMEMLASGNISANRKQKTNSNDSSAEIDTDKKDKIDQALIRFFVCCGIPFSTVDHPYFIDFVQNLCFGYNPPKRTALSTTILNKEVSAVLTKIKQILRYQENLTLAVDGWSDSLGRSIYAFVIITPNKKQYIHALVDESNNSHTGSFNATEIEKVLTSIGSNKFVAVVSDAESAMQMARRLISENYPNILSIRCMAHHLNLITADIIKLDFAKNVFKKCQAIITFFKTSHRAGASLNENIIESLTQGGGLKTSVKTRWSTAWDCCDSIIRLENNLKHVLETHPEIFRNASAVKSHLRNRQFWQDVEQLRAILAPVKRAVESIEAESSNMASTFLELIKMAVAIKKIPNSINSDFKKKCIGIFNKRWKQFDTDVYLICYFLHPKYRATGIQDEAFRQMCLNAMKIWSKFGNGSTSCGVLLSQIRRYSEGNKEPYDLRYTERHNDLDTPELWWSTCRQPDNYIQQLALKLFAITPHQASCERIFSILNWMIGNRRTRLDIARLQSMAQIHSYYITNAKSELKFSGGDLNEDELKDALQEITAAMINNNDIFDEEDDDFSLDSESINLDGENTDKLLMSSIIDLDAPEFEDTFSSGEKSGESDMSSDSIQIQPNEDFNSIDFEAILAREFN